MGIQMDPELTALAFPYPKMPPYFDIHRYNQFLTLVHMVQRSLSRELSAPVRNWFLQLSIWFLAFMNISYIFCFFFLGLLYFSYRKSISNCVRFIWVSLVHLFLWNLSYLFYLMPLSNPCMIFLEDLQGLFLILSISLHHLRYYLSFIVFLVICSFFHMVVQLIASQMMLCPVLGTSSFLKFPTNLI